MSNEKWNRTKAKNKQNPQVDTQAVKILRNVGDNEAFYFYEAIGKPTGEVAKNLSDFLNKVKSLKSQSLMFHQQRRDFQNWVQKILGDTKLAGKLGGISSSNSDVVRASVCRTVENRIKELQELSATVTIGENPVALLPSS